MAFSPTYGAWLSFRYQRQGKPHRPNAIDTLQAAVGAQLMRASGALYRLLRDRDTTPLRGEVGDRKRARRSDAIKGMGALLAALIDNMAQTETTGYGFFLGKGKAVGFTFVAKSFRMSRSTLSRHVRDFAALGLLKVIRRKKGEIAVKFISVQILRACGLLHLFATKEAKAVNEEELAKRAGLALVLDGVQRAGRKRKVEPLKPQAPLGRPPEPPPLPDGPPSVQACMAAMRAHLNL